MNILVTECNGTCDNVMVFIPDEFRGKIGPSLLGYVLKNRGFTYTEAYEVPQAEMQYYLYEPCWLTPEDCNNILKQYDNDKRQSAVVDCL